MRTHTHTRFVSIAITLILACAPLSASAQTPPSVNVPDHCSASDINGVSHTYAGQFLGICALVAAKEQGAVSAYELAYDNAFGFYLQSLAGIVPSATQYWALYKNSAFSSDGLSSMTLAEGDLLAFQLTDWTDNSNIGSPVTFTVNLIASTQSAPGPVAIASSLTLHNPFDVPLALSYITGNQRADGSFDSPLTSDWVAIAFSGGGAGDALNRMRALFAHTIPELASVTDYERHAMALEALGIDPHTGTSVNYISHITDAFDGTQIGDTSLINDDVFAIFPLLHAGYSADDDIIWKTASFILSKQKGDGSWEGSVDITSAAIQALAEVRSLSGTDAALRKASDYLRSQQNDDGGWGNSFTTSWVLQAITALGDSPNDWAKSLYRTPRYYLATFQERDGGVEPSASGVPTRVWATAYAIPAIQGKTWSSLLGSFPKPGISSIATPTSEIQSIATSTPQIDTIQNTESTASASRRIVASSLPENKTVAVAPETHATSGSSAQIQTAAAGSIPVSLFIIVWHSVISFLGQLF